MLKNNLRKNIEILEEIINENEQGIFDKFKDKVSPLKGVIQLWSSFTKDEFIELFKTCMEKTNLDKVCLILEEIYNWKIIDNQYRPEFGLDIRNTMDQAIKNLLKFLEKEEILDICTGFFSPNVWELIGDEFEKIHGIRLLIGNEYEIPKDSTERIQDVFQDLLRIKKEKNEREDLTHLEKSTIIHKSLIEDTSIDDFNLTKSILDLLNFLERNTVDVKLQKYPFQHGKLYLSNKIAYLGSSNFTKNGLIGNRELNIQIQDKKLLTKLKNWYDQQFDNGTPYKEELIKLIKRSKFGNYPYTPFEVYMKMAFEQYKEDFLKIIEEGKIELAQFQAEGASKALGVIKKFGGVLIADAVGLGKSFTAMSIIENLKFFRGLVICPAQLRAKWKRYMNLFPACEVYSMEEMSRAVPRMDDIPKDYDLIMIDESHNFRTRGTKRYNNLLNLLEHSSNARIIMLTATPINTKLEDLQNQLILICGLGKGFPLIGIPDLKDYFKKIENGMEDIDLLKQHLMVAHSRAMIRNRQKVHHIDIMLPNEVMIEFPDRTLKTIKYSIVPISEESLVQYNEKLEEWRAKMTAILETTKDREKLEKNLNQIEIERPSSPSEDFYQTVFDTLDSLKLVPFNLELYKDPEYREKEVLQRNKGIVSMLRTTLLKRMESSLYSFIQSLKNQIKLCYIFENLLEKGYVATSMFIEKLEKLMQELEGEDDSEVEETGEEMSFEALADFIDELSVEKIEKMRSKQLTEEQLAEIEEEEDKYFKYLKKIEPEEYLENYKEKMIKDVAHDQEKLEELLEMTEKIFTEGDYKLDEMKAALSSLIQSADNEAEKKIVIFSYYRTTADYIFNNLINDKDWNNENNNPTIKKITGDTPSETRINYVERFAPHSCLLELQGASKIKKKEELEKLEGIDILISTDVLSEGQNLQDGRYVINYDLHWNPVRMIQRSGRIDRLGALHKKVGIFNFFPQTGLERLLRLVERLRLRLTTIDDALGLDADTLVDGDAKHKRRLEEEQKRREDEKRKKDELLRIEKEDVNIIEEFEERMEFGGSDIAKIKLFGEIRKQGYDYYQNHVPLGIHSGLVNLDRSGFIVVISLINEDVEQLKWVYWDENEEFRKKFNHNYGLLIDKPKVEKMVDNLVSEWQEIKKAKFPDEERVLIEEPQVLFREVIDIIQKFKKCIKKEDKIKSLKSKKPIKGNGVYYSFISKAIQERVIKKKYAEKFLNLLFEKSIPVLAKEERVEKIINKFNAIRKKIEALKVDLEVDKLDKEDLIKELYKEGAKNLLDDFYKYMERVEMKIKQKSQIKIEDKNLKLVGFIRLYKLKEIEKEQNL